MFGNQAVTYYVHLLVEHLLEVMKTLLELGLSLPAISQEGLEQGNSRYKLRSKRKTSPASKLVGKNPIVQYLEHEIRPKHLVWSGKQNE